MSINWNEAAWRTSSSSDGGGCVEVAYLDGVIGLRDTKDKGNGPVLEFTEYEWSCFSEGMGLGEFTIENLSK